MASALRRLPALAAAASAAAGPAVASVAPEVSKAAASFFARTIHSSSITRGVSVIEGNEHVTGIEREELEYEAEKGVNPFAEEWATAAFGTLESPKVVPSLFAERIVGVVDPDDDSHLLWSTIKEGEPPKQIIEGGEYFVLKRLPGGPSH